MQLNDKQMRQLLRWGAGIAVVCILVFFAARNAALFTGVIQWVYGLFSSLILGFFLALILNVPMAYFERVLFSAARSPKLKKLSRPLSILLALALILGISTAVVGLIIPELIEAIRIIIDSVSNIARKLADMDHDSISSVYMPLIELLEQI
ncbi:MAG: hypothetical protein IIY16_02790, partial [Oscillospiraceae bacterium]|nr:hypothetical protein [Oscillospiraceae bacterium]